MLPAGLVDMPLCTRAPDRIRDETLRRQRQEDAIVSGGAIGGVGMPFTEIQFFDVFRQYNLGTWPIPLVITLVGVVLAGGMIARRLPVRTAWWSLAVLWAWMALAYHVKFFSTINPLAYGFAVLFMVQAAAFIVLARASSTHGTPDVGRIRSLASNALFVYALVLYPLIGMALGQRYPSLPTLGLPCPTTIFTIAVLIRLGRLAPVTLFVIPVIWSSIATVAAFTFHVGEDLPLLPFVALGLIFRLWPMAVDVARRPRTYDAEHLREKKARGQLTTRP